MEGLDSSKHTYFVDSYSNCIITSLQVSASSDDETPSPHLSTYVPKKVNEGNQGAPNAVLSKI